MAHIDYTQHDVGTNTYINKSHLVCGEDPTYHGIIWAGDIDWRDVVPDSTTIKLKDSASIITKLEEILPRLRSLEERVNQLEQQSETPSTVYVVSVSLSPSNITLTSAGSTQQLIATIYPTDATNQNVTWSSSNPSVATVDNNGLVTAITNGTTTITAMALDGSNVQGTSSVSVNIEQVPEATAILSSDHLVRRRTNNITTLTWELSSVPSSITSGETTSFDKGEVKAIYSGRINDDTTIITANIQGELEIISTNENVVTIGTVNKNGTTVITGINEGSSRIIVTDNNNIVNSFDVYVGNEPLIDDVTSNATFTPSAGTISGNTITAPTVQTNTEVTITVSYNGVTASTQKVYTATPAEIYYWYVGTEKPTSLSQASTVTSYPEESTYTNNSGAKSHIFALTNSNKNVTFINLATGNPIDQNEVDTTTISGYKIFETAIGTANTGTIKIRIS